MPQWLLIITALMPLIQQLEPMIVSLIDEITKAVNSNTPPAPASLAQLKMLSSLHNSLIAARDTALANALMP